MSQNCRFNYRPVNILKFTQVNGITKSIVKRIMLNSATLCGTNPTEKKNKNKKNYQINRKV